MAKKKESRAAYNRRMKWYGMKRLKSGQKICWLAKQDKHGYAIGLALGPRTLWLRNFRVPNRKEVCRVMERTSLVFINLKHQ